MERPNLRQRQSLLLNRGLTGSDNIGKYNGIFRRHTDIKPLNFLDLELNGLGLPLQEVLYDEKHQRIHRNSIPAGDVLKLFLHIFF